MGNYEMAKRVSWENQVPGSNLAIVEVPEYLLDEFEAFTTDHIISFSSLEKLGDKSSLIPSITKWANSHASLVDTSPGFVCFQCRGRDYTDVQLRTLYLLLSSSLGILNDRYGALFDVKDRGLDYTKEAVPVSKTKASTGFHTDSTAKEYSPDIVGLLCLQPGRKGGESLLVNGANLYCWMHDNQPLYLPLLGKPIVRDVITPGTINNKEAILKNKFPIFSFDDAGIRFRYMRYWITTGHEKTETPLQEELQEAMDHIDSYLNDEANCFKFKLSRGDMLFVNNRFLCHNRTEYEDWKEEDKKRTLVRTWINSPNSN